MILRIGILTVSDRAHRGQYEDLSGPAILEALNDYIASDWEAMPMLVPDEQVQIEAALISLAEDQGCGLIVTTGGTGPTLRDVTPEATMAVCTKVLPGFGERMRAVSMEKVPTAILSRQLAGIRGTCLILNLPGKPRAIRECLDAVIEALPDGIDIIGGHKMELRKEPQRENE